MHFILSLPASPLLCHLLSSLFYLVAHGLSFLCHCYVTGCYWLIRILRGNLQLPSRDQQLASIATEYQFKQEYMQFETTRSATVGPRFHSYVDQLCDDLGISKIRKSNALSDFLMPWRASDFKGNQKIDQKFQQTIIKKSKKAFDADDRH